MSDPYRTPGRRPSREIVVYKGDLHPQVVVRYRDAVDKPFVQPCAWGVGEVIPCEYCGSFRTADISCGRMTET